jgi:8-oxo-dGTP pyrophosphatase MutT (NUDIX family)
MFAQFSPWKNLHPENLKRAAVGIILGEADDGSGEIAFLLTVRSSKMRSHAGQYALPGGRIEQGEDPVDTVIRESMEEIGLALSRDQVLGILDVYVTQSGYAVTPVVFATSRGAELNLNPDEVEEIFRIKLSDFSGDRSAEFFHEEEGGPRLIRLPIFDHHLHAPTAAMIYQFIELVGGRYQPVDTFGAPDFARR